MPEHIDALLTNISVAHIQTQDKFIATKVFPIIPVAKQSGLYLKYKQEDWFRDEAQKRADSTESAGSGYEVGSDSYRADVYAFHKDVGDQIKQNSDVPLQPLADAARFVAGRMLIRQERQFVSDYLKTGVWGTDMVGVAGTPGANEFKQFDQLGTSDPLIVAEEVKDTIARKTGYDANTAVLGSDVYKILKNHPDIADRIKYTSAENVTLQLIARLLEIDRVFVMKTIFNTAPEGKTGTYQYNFAKDAWFGHVADAPGLLTPSAGYTFAWDGVSDGQGLTIGTTQFRMQELRADRVESQSAWDNKVVAPELGVYLSGVVA
ncbi:major capsid protein [Arthrobacter phage Waltz]|nr:major capsid protein [Arthrobacter phage Waltz]